MVSNNKLSVLVSDESDRTAMRDFVPSSWDFVVAKEYHPPAGEAPGAPVKPLNRDNGSRLDLEGAQAHDSGLENVNRRLFVDGLSR